MQLNQFDLKFAKYLTEHDSINLDDLPPFLEKDKTNLYRSIKRCNAYLPTEKQIQSLSRSMKSTLSYLDYREIFSQLTLKNYSSNKQERVELLISCLCLQKILNKKSLYEEIGMSNSSLKQDSELLASELKKLNLNLQIHKRKGTQLIGNESTIRFYIIKKLSQLLTIDKDLNLFKKATITPIEEYIVELFFKQHAHFIDKSKTLYNKIKAEQNFELSYNSRKLVIIYLNIFQYRTNNSLAIRNKNKSPIGDHKTISITNNKTEENFLFSYFFYSLNFKNGNIICYDEKLLGLVKEFSCSIKNYFITEIKNIEDFDFQLYLTIKNIIDRRRIGIFIRDKKLDRVELEHPSTYQAVQNLVPIFEHEYKVNFDHDSLATLSLIIKKHTERNKSSDRKRKKLCFITNSSENKLGYLFEKLRNAFHIEITESLDINELYKIKKLNPDFIVCFTKKIETMIKQHGLTSTRINFHADDDEIIKFGKKLKLSRSGRKIPINIFLNDIRKKSDDEISSILKTKYSDYFI